MTGGIELQVIEYHGIGAVLARKLSQNLKTFPTVDELISELKKDCYIVGLFYISDRRLTRNLYPSADLLKTSLINTISQSDFCEILFEIIDFWGSYP